MGVVASYATKQDCVNVAILPADCQPGRPLPVVLPRIVCSTLSWSACIAVCEHASLFSWLAELFKWLVLLYCRQWT